jgi:mannose-6-phosphate isomerase
MDSTEEENVRPWGRYDVLSEESGHKVKRVTVLPGKRLSLQVHERREEHWFVVRGEARVRIGRRSRRLRAGDSVDIARGVEHRMANVGDEDLVIIEVQRGDYLGEDDIRRIEDDFGRA